MPDIESFREKIQTLIEKFEKDKPHYLSKGYPEAQVRVDFLNPFFKALGWDIENKALRVTPQRVKVEEKPEVRKAGGVYYTPKYIVDYIVNNTVGKLIEGKTPRQIEKVKILDPACY